MTLPIDSRFEELTNAGQTLTWIRVILHREYGVDIREQVLLQKRCNPSMTLSQHGNAEKTSQSTGISASGSTLAL